MDMRKKTATGRESENVSWIIWRWEEEKKKKTQNFLMLFFSSLSSAGLPAQEDLVYFLKGLAYKADLFLALASSNKNEQ